MPNLDELLTGDVADAAAEAVASPPDLDALRHRGDRRRRVRRTALAGIAAAAVVAAIGVGQVPGADRSTPADQRPKPSPSQVNPANLTPEEIVDNPRATLSKVAVSPTDSDVRATVWQLCGSGRCARATAVTADGFETRAVIKGGQSWELTPLGSRGFLFTEYGMGVAAQLLAPDGSVSLVEIEDEPERPLADGEVVLGIPGEDMPWGAWLAIDPVTGSARVLSFPDHVRAFVQQPGGRLEVLRQDGASEFQWSDDGGISWRKHALPKNSSALYQLVPSGQPSTMALVEGGDGATNLPFGAVHVSRDGGDTWERISQDEQPAAYVGTAAVLPDGRLLAHLHAWSDDTEQPADRSHGFYVGADWRDLEPLDMGAPFTADQAPHGPDVLAVHAGAEAVTIYAASESDDLFRTTDNGMTWEEVQTR